MAFAANGVNNSVDDANGNELLKFSATASAINEIQVGNAAVGANPRLTATGGDTNVSMALRPKGTTGIIQIEDGNGNEVLKGGVATASAVNEVTVTNAATGSGPTIAATGGDTNVPLNLAGKGTGATAITNGYALTGDITPTGLSGNVDDYNPTGADSCSRMRIDANGAHRNITGLANGADGRVIILHNITGGAFNLVLKHDVTSSAANRFYTPGAADYTISQYGSAICIYDATLSRWLVMDKS